MGWRFQRSYVYYILIFIGVNLTFFPQHFMGLIGIPRRYVVYRDLYLTYSKIRTYRMVITLSGVIIFIRRILIRINSKVCDTQITTPLN